MDRIAIVLRAGGEGELGQLRARSLPHFQVLGLDVYLACPSILVPAARALAESSAGILGVFDSESHGFLEQVLRSFGRMGYAAVAFLPVTADLDWHGWRDVAGPRPAFMIWPPPIRLPLKSACEDRSSSLGWVASPAIGEAIFGRGVTSHLDVSSVVDAVSHVSPGVRWGSSSLAAETAPQAGAGAPALTRRSTVLAIVPHFRCERWLCQCLDSLVAQKRPLDGIVVVDDASTEPPSHLVGRYPGVSLVRSRQNVGPYCLIQAVIDLTEYDAYLLQDADDWSTSERLERLLTEAERTGAELVGSQEFRVRSEESRIQLVCYPLDVNEALAERPRFSLLHPTSLVARSLIRKAGGFATGLRFGGDTEFLLRAARFGRVANVAAFCYYHRVRASSLTTDPATGIGSPARTRLWHAIQTRDAEERQRIAAGEPPSPSPLCTREPAILDHICGPPLA